MWPMGLVALRHLLGPGMEPVHPKFAGTLLSTILPGNSPTLSYSGSKIKIKIKSNQAENKIQISSNLYKISVLKNMWASLWVSGKESTGNTRDVGFCLVRDPTC